jgi:hypothetical protein
MMPAHHFNVAHKEKAGRALNHPAGFSKSINHCLL